MPYRHSTTHVGPLCRTIDGLPGGPQTNTMANEDEREMVVAVIERLAKRFPDAPRTLVEEIVSEEYTALNDGPIRDYVPVLIERAAKVRLSSAAKGT